MRSKKLLFYLFGILMMCLYAQDAESMTLRGIGGWGNVKTMVLVETNHWRCYFTRTELDDGNEFKFAEDDASAWYSGTNFSFNLANNSSVSSEEFNGEGTNMVITNYDNYDYYVDLYKTNDNKYNFTIIRADEYLTIKGFNNWNNTVEDNTLLQDFSYNRFTHHWTFYVKKENLGNGEFKLFDTYWASDGNPLNLSSSNTATSTVLGNSSGNMTLSVPQTDVNDARYYFDISWGTTGYSVTVNREHREVYIGGSMTSNPSEVACLDGDNYNQTWGQKNNSLKLIEARNGEYYIDFDAVQFNNSNRLTRLGSGKGMDFRFVEVVTTNNDAAADVNISADKLELTSSYQSLAGTSTGNDDYMSVTSETNCSKYRIWFKYDNGSRYAKVEKVVPDIYIYGSISDNPSETSGGSWGGGSHPNRKLTAISDGEYKISFDATAFSNSNRKTGIDDPWIGMDFRFREMTQLSNLSEKYHIFPPQEHDALALTSTYSANGYITSSILNANTFMGVAEVDGATYYDIYLKRTESGGSISYQAKVVVTADDQTNVFIGGSMSNDCSNTAVTTTNQTWDQRNNSLKLTYDGTVKAYYIDFSPTEYDNSDRHTLLNDGTAMDFRLLERVTASGSTTSYRCAGSSTAQALSTDPENPTVLSASTSATNNYLYLEKVARATNYRIWFKDDNGTRTAWVEISQPYATLTVRGNATPINGVPTATGYTFTIPKEDYYELNSTMTFQVALTNELGATTYIANTAVSAMGTAFTYTTQSDAGNITYGVPANAADEITVTINTEDNEITVTHGTQGNSGISQNYYVVGTWFEGGFDYTDYDERRFQMKKNSDGSYYFDIPANMNLNCQIISSTGTLYYPTTSPNYELHGANRTVSDQTAASSAKPTPDATDLTPGNRWYFHGDKSDITIPDGIAKIVAGGKTYLDGYFRLTFNPTTDKWSVDYSPTRVSYLSAAVNNWKVDFLYDAQRDHRHFGSSYIDTQGFTILNAWGRHDNTPNLYPLSKLKEKGNNGQNGLIGGANLNLTPMDGTTTDGNVIPLSLAGLYLVEDDPTRGSEVYANEGPWDNLLLFNAYGGSDPNPVFETLSIVGPAFPETMSGETWDVTKAIDLYYDTEEECYKTTVTTTNAEAVTNLFRFIANRSFTTNWGEESTAAADQAKVPYDGSGTGHAATDADHNVVKITTNGEAGNRSGSGENRNYGDIIFNRPAGSWVIRFYVQTNDNNHTTSFYYTITESTEPDAVLTPPSGTYRTTSLTKVEDEYQMVVGVNVMHAPKYRYSIGSTISLEDHGTVETYDASSPFGTFSYNGDATSPEVWFKPYGGGEKTQLTVANGTLILNGPIATVHVNIAAAEEGGASRSAERTYVYTFGPSEPLHAITGGHFINKTTVYVEGGQGTLTYSTAKHSNQPVPSNRLIELSTPGTLTVTDTYIENNATVTATQSADFTFTYSTSENYTNFWHNTPGEKLYVGGGLNATSVFVELEDNMPLRIYAYNYSKDQMLIEQQEKKQEGYSQTAEGFNERDPQVKLTSYYPGTVLDETHTYTIDGKRYFYLVVPEEKLQYKDGDDTVTGQMAIIISKSTRASSKSDADHWKTANTIVDPNTTYVYHAVPNDMSGTNVSTINSYLDQDPTMLFGDNYVFCEVPATWTNVFCYAYDGADNNTWPGVQMKFVKKKTENNETRNVYAVQLPSKFTTETTKLIFVERIGTDDGSRYDGDDGEGFNYVSRRCYKDDSGSYEQIFYNDTAETDIATWVDKAYSSEETYSNYPNGEEYHDMRPDDKTYMLDPTWGGLIPDPTTSTDKETYSIAHWSGFPEIDNTADLGYRKTIDYDVNLTQTVLHLDKDKEYTVQAIVHAEGEHGTKVRLTLNGATEAVDEQIGRDASGNVGTDVGGSFISKTGRVEYLTPKEYESMNKLTGTGWLKLQAKAKPDPATGNLQITLKGIAAEGKAASYGWFVLADVVLLEDADRDDGTTYRTTATKITSTVTYGTGTLDMDTYADYRDWVSTASSQKNNAFSFFDRGENRNAVVFANEHTVLCLPGHEHPYNVVKTTSATDQAGVCPVLYLTDMGIPDVQSTNSAEYKGSGYTFKPVIPFTATNVVYDRSYALTKSTIILPFTLTQAQIKAAYSNNVKVYKFQEYHADSKDVVFSKLGDEEDLAANQPYILFNATGTLDSRNFASGVASTMSIPEVNAADNLYPATEETSVAGAFTGRYDYARMRTYGNNNSEAYYGYNNNQFLIVNSAGANMKPFRAYFTVPYSGESTLAPALSISFLDEPQVTGITDVEDHSQKDGYIYSVNGMLIRRDSRTDSLPKGIYILNGRKFVVK